MAVFVSHICFLSLYTMVGFMDHLSFFYFLGILVAFGLVLYQQWLIKERNQENCFKAFMNNQWMGCVLFLGTYLSFLLK